MKQTLCPLGADSEQSEIVDVSDEGMKPGSPGCSGRCCREGLADIPGGGEVNGSLAGASL